MCKKQNEKLCCQVEINHSKQVKFKEEGKKKIKKKLKTGWKKPSSQIRWAT